MYALVSLTAVRMLPVAIAMLGSGARLLTLGFLGWFGPRGLASIVFAVIVVEQSNLPHEHLIVLAIYLTVGLDLFARRPHRRAVRRPLRPLVRTGTRGSTPRRWKSAPAEVTPARGPKGHSGSSHTRVKATVPPATRRRRSPERGTMAGTPVLDLLTTMTMDSVAASSLEPRELMIARLAALAAVDAPTLHTRRTSRRPSRSASTSSARRAS